MDLILSCSFQAETAGPSILVDLAKLIAIEQHRKSRNLMDYIHPERAVYLLGTEEEGLPASVLDKAYQIVEIPAMYELSFNVHVAGSLVMYDRLRKSRD